MKLAEKSAEKMEKIRDADVRNINFFLYARPGFDPVTDHKCIDATPGLTLVHFALGKPFKVDGTLRYMFS